MCYEGKCLYCIPVKRACLVSAIIIAIFNGLILLAYVIYLGNFLVQYLASRETSGIVRVKRCYYDDSYREKEMFRQQFRGLIAIWYVIVIPLVALLNFIFSSLLCTGIRNNRPKLVKAYFWYGIVITVLAAIASAGMLYIDSLSPYYINSETVYTALAILIGCVLHALFLVMVHHTHKKVLQDSKFNNHIRLDDREFTAEKKIIKV